jgi:hypothetical protein
MSTFKMLKLKMLELKMSISKCRRTHLLMYPFGKYSKLLHYLDRCTLLSMNLLYRIVVLTVSGNAWLVRLNILILRPWDALTRMTSTLATWQFWRGRSERWDFLNPNNYLIVITYNYLYYVIMCYKSRIRWKRSVLQTIISAPSLDLHNMNLSRYIHNC